MTKRRPRTDAGLEGVLVVDKPDGPTSHDIVTTVKRALRARKAGHTGTLDPFATGVLPVCLGRATKLAGFLTGDDKAYRAVAVFGVQTSSQDRTGNVTEEREVGEITEADVREAMKGFTGAIQQVPPMHSAVKIDGKRLYELAREGKEIDRPARTVTVYRFELESLDLPKATFYVESSKGTYIRTLLADLGEVVGPGAHVAELRRVRAGGFTDAMSIAYDDVMTDPEAAMAHIIPVDAVPLQMRDIQLGEAASQRILHGVVPKTEPGPPGRVALRSAAGVLLAIGEVNERGLELLRVIATV